MRIEENGLTVDIYIKLRKTVGFIEYRPEDVKVALKNTIYSLVAYDEMNNPIGMCRVIGDGRITFFIKDVVVIPERQKEGIGTCILKKLMEHINKIGAHNAQIGVMSTPNFEFIYEREGFIKRPNDKYGSGLVQYLKRR